jgi:hypothetical protein
MKDYEMERFIIDMSTRSRLVSQVILEAKRDGTICQKIIISEMRIIFYNEI